MCTQIIAGVWGNSALVPSSRVCSSSGQAAGLHLELRELRSGRTLAGQTVSHGQYSAGGIGSPDVLQGWMSWRLVPAWFAEVKAKTKPKKLCDELVILPCPVPVGDVSSVVAEFLEWER